jgi:hypothetical protein
LILTYRDTVSLLDSSSNDPLKPYKDLLLDLTINDPVAKEKVVELLKYQHHFNEAKQLSEWTVPRFPVSGTVLATSGIKQGPTYKIILNELREAWKTSNYQATEAQLIDEVLPTVLEKLANTNTKSASSGSQPKKRKE